MPKVHLPAHHLMVERILFVYGQAEPIEQTAGLRWYDSAHLFAAGLARSTAGRRYRLSVRRAAGIIAALSPQKGWQLNQALADDLVRTETCGQTERNVWKARSILFGEDPTTVLAPPNPARITGRKVRSFFDNIVDPKRSTAVTVDRHALDIVTATYGNTISLDDAGRYDRVADAYRDAAALVGLRPHEIQAITWVTWRRVKGIAEDRY